MTLDTILKGAVANAMGSTLAETVQEIVSRETRRALSDHEDRLTALVRKAVQSAIAELIANGEGVA